MKHGGDIYSFERETGMKPLDFSENTNPLGLPENAKHAIANSLHLYSVYPDVNCRKLTTAVADFYDINSQYLLFANGAADLIFKIAYNFTGERAVVLAPTFSEYEIALENAQISIERYFLSPNFEILEDILEIVDEKIVFICNPNNPTGKLCSPDLLEKIAQKAKILVVDECFMDFVDQKEQYSFINKLKKYPNVIILKAFTKIYALAGLRLGFCVCADKNLLKNINTKGQPWSVSTVAQVAGIACLKDEQYLEKTHVLVQKERKFLKNELEKLGFTVFEGVANYIFFKAFANLDKKLEKYGIMIRSCQNYVGLNENYYRIAVKTHEDNVKLIETIKKVGDS